MLPLIDAFHGKHIKWITNVHEQCPRPPSSFSFIISISLIIISSVIIVIISMNVILITAEVLTKRSDTGPETNRTSEVSN